MKKIANEILKKKNLKQNLPVYNEYMESMYNSFANICFAFNYYTYWEMKCDSAKSDCSELAKITLDLNSIIKKYVDIKDKSELTRSISDIRNKIISDMKILTAYADIFDRFEYLLNRIEYKFSEAEIPLKYSDEDFTRNIMQYITSDNDSVVINTKISEIIAELPMRMAKNKFFEHLNEGFGIYKETDKKSLDDFIYMMSSSAMIYIPKNLTESFNDIASIYSEMKNADYMNLTSEQYDDFHNKINYASSFIQENVNNYMIMQQIVNDLYSLVITSPYITDNNEEYEYCSNIINWVIKRFDSDDTSYPENEVEDSLVNLEGMQERFHEKYMQYEYVLDFIKTDIADEITDKNIKEELITLFSDQVLLSDSLFVELEGNTQVINEQTLTEQYFEEKKNSFFESTKVFFDNHDRLVNRAVMASIISSLPVFFNNISELQDYIYNSLNSCRDTAEKAACIEIISSIIEQAVSFGEDK